MDPLEKLHDHVHELIFQHLTVDEVLNSSLTSKLWYKAIGRSNDVMGKIWLNVGDRFNEPTKYDLKAFRGSERIYQNFKISEIENGLQILVFPKREWRRAQMDIQSFINYKDYIHLLQIFSETIVELEIFDMDIEDDNSNILKLDFKELQKLRFEFVTAVALKPFNQKLKKLERLSLGNIISDGGEALNQFISLQSQITHLSLSSDAFYKIFEVEKEFSFKLKYLLVEYAEKCEKDNSRNVVNNFVKFIQTQEQLKWITLCEWTNIEVVQEILNSKFIERVSFDYFDNESTILDVSTIKLNQSRSIKHIDFDCENIDGNWKNWIKPIIESCGEVTKIYFFHIHEELFEFVVENCKHLTSLEYCSIFKGFENNFNELKFKNDRNNLKIVENKFLDLRKEIFN
ncbi:CLUMA_CG013218, isoform A [Clunio marinus]|uniref:CLUMA_CG013218, isoform A n=1 Tax=Clunio marinus TaxID=568069 RepID=A0A1J1II82_9DIPT|nr:CLUMA_CG013218, isoform A [Clunio marinus]